VRRHVARGLSPRRPRIELGISSLHIYIYIYIYIYIHKKDSQLTTINVAQAIGQETSFVDKDKNVVL